MSSFRALPLPFDGERVVRLLVQDLAHTLASTPEAELPRVRREADHAAEYARDQLTWAPSADEPEEAAPSLAEVQAAYEQRVVDEVQQTLHDTHTHTSWPPCPRHGRHPLWYEHGSDAWCCPTDGSAVAPLGMLHTIRAAG